MKPSVFALSVAAVTLFAATGCAAEAEQGVAAREPAYPIGYTPPDKRIAPPAQPPPRPAYAVEPSTSSEVVVGDDDGQTEATGGQPAQPPSAAAGADEYADTDPAALTDFRSTLDPYGNWQEDPTYGTVWVPSRAVVGEDFTPYVSAGHWVYDDDYVWVSDYSWGWAPFHYGRWAYAPAVGWEWVPGRHYAGAWVSWRYGLDDWAYVGWAPLPPLWGWRGGFAFGYGFVPYAPYAFVPCAHLFAPGIGARLVTGAAVGPIASHTQPWSPPSAGRVAAHPGVGGPPPSALHIQASAVAHATSAERGIAQAHAFARPSSAVALGARAPMASSVNGAHTPYSGGSRAPYAAYSAGSAGAGARAPAYAQPGASHFGGRFGAGFTGNPASAPPSRAAPSYSGSQPYAGRSYGGAPASPSYSHPSAPSYHSYSGYSGGGSTFHGGTSPGHSFGSGGFSGGGSVHSSGGGGGFHSGGGGGGHFGGGGGGGHGGGHR